MIIDYDFFYRQYLGCESTDNSYVKSIYRDKPINKDYYYPFIKSLYQSKQIISVSPQIYRVAYAGLSIDKISYLSLKKLEKLFPEVNKKSFYRYSFDNKIDNISNSTQILQDKHKEFFMQSGKNLNPVFKEEKWLKLKENIVQQNMFVELCDNKIVSSCKISDIYCGAANLYVYTDEKYRNCGFGKKVVSMAVKICFERGLLPVYFVEKNNIASVKLVTSLGGRLFSEEECFCVVK